MKSQQALVTMLYDVDMHRHQIPARTLSEHIWHCNTSRTRAGYIGVITAATAELCEKSFEVQAAGQCKSERCYTSRTLAGQCRSEHCCISRTLAGQCRNKHWRTSRTLAGQCRSEHCCISRTLAGQCRSEHCCARRTLAGKCGSAPLTVECSKCLAYQNFVFSVLLLPTPSPRPIPSSPFPNISLIVG
jgi:hypothetical protein